MNKQKLWFITWKLDKNNIARFFSKKYLCYSGAKCRAIEPTPPARLWPSSRLDHGQPTHFGTFVKSMYLHMSHISSFSNNYASNLKLKDYNVILSSLDHINKNCRHKVLKGNSPRIAMYFIIGTRTHTYFFHWLFDRVIVCSLCCIFMFLGVAVSLWFHWCPSLE